MIRFNLAICFCLILPFTLFAEQPSGSPDLVKDFASLLKLLNEDGVTHQTHMKDSAVSIPTEKGPIDGVLVIRWDAEQGFAHFIQPFMMPIPKDKIADMEAAMMRLNHAIPYPGLGINHETGHPYFRMSIAVLGEGLSAHDVRRYFSHTLAQAAKWHPQVKSVLNGAPSDRVVESYNATQFPTGQFTTKVIGSSWTLNFDGEDSLTLQRDGQEVVQSTYEIRGKLIRFVDRGGSMSTKTPGVYTWKIEGDQLRFEVVEDESKGRQMVLGHSPWSPVASKPAPTAQASATPEWQE